MRIAIGNDVHIIPCWLIESSLELVPGPSAIVHRTHIMATNSTIPQDAIRNPYTTLAFMPPDVADQFQVKCYLNIVVLAVRSMHF